MRRMFWRPPAGSRLTHGVAWSREVYRGAAWIYTVLAVITTIAAWQVPFGERIDFDVTGFLFLLTSLPALIAWSFALAFGVGAAYCWTRSMLAPPRNDYFS